MNSPEQETANDILVVYESPYKYKQIRKLFDQLGIECSFAFTQGRVFDLPNDKLGLGDHGDMELIPVNDTRHKHLIAQIRKHDTIFCMTDMDDEGEWIADSVKRLCFENNAKSTFLRLRLHELSSSSLRNAIELASEALDLDAISTAHARRYIDRFIGYSENKEEPDMRGRVLTPLLYSIYEKPIKQLSLTTIETDNVIITCEHSLSEDELYSSLHSQLKKFKRVSRPRLDTLPNTSDVLDYQMCQLDECSATDSFSEIQELYQAGKISYHRTPNSKYYVMEGQHSGIRCMDPDDNAGGHSTLSFVNNRTLHAKEGGEIIELVPPKEVLSALIDTGIKKVTAFVKSKTSHESLFGRSFYSPQLHFMNQTSAKKGASFHSRDLNINQLILRRINELNIAQPSTLHTHIDKVRKLLDIGPEITLSRKGLMIALQSDEISVKIRDIDVIHQINETLYQAGREPEDKVVQCLHILRQGAGIEDNSFTP